MSAFLRSIAQSPKFQYTVLALIVVAAILVGLETSPWIVSHYGQLLKTLNDIVLWAFVVEAAIKMGQHGWRFYRYFFEPWNIFDFAVIAVCFLPINAQYVAVMRLARIFRALRLITAVPRLQMLVNALIKSFPSMGYVGLLLVLLFYVYGVMGVGFFRDNDPMHFGDLPTTMLTLFTVVTQEGWNEILYTQMYGWNDYPPGLTSIKPKSPSGQPLLAAVYFISFIFLGTMILMNLFIGIIVNSMEEVQNQSDANRDAELPTEATPASAWDSVSGRLGDIDQQLSSIREQLVAIRGPIR